MPDILSPNHSDPSLAPAPDVDKLSEDFRLSEVDRGRHSLSYFTSAICGLTDPHPRTGKSRLAPIHYDLMSFLEGREPHHPWDQAVVCAFRGMGKSTLCRTYALWRSLYLKNFSVLLVSNSATNAQQNHFLPIVRLLQESRRSEYIKWLFQERWPEGELANMDRLSFRRDDPQAGPSIYYLGVESKFEGQHPDLCILDDPEGSEAEKSKTANQDAYNVYQKVIPLPREPTESQILIVATPHGPRPITWRLRDDCNWKSEADNATSPIRFFWKPIESENGTPAWPEKFPKEWINARRKQPVFSTQFLLKRKSRDASIFEMQKIYDACYEWIGPTKDQIAYKAFAFDPEKLSDEGYVRPELKDAVVRLAQCRTFLHFDPLHRSAEEKKNIAYARPAKAAITVVAVAPDFHCFLIDYYVGDVGLDVQAPELFRLYQLYAPYLVTYENVGAQAWLMSYVKMCEQQSPYWQNPKSAGIIPGIPVMQLPRLSTRLRAGEKDVQSKEFLWREALSPWLHHGVLHVRRDQHEVLQQLENVSDERQSVDLLDCLAQGASGLADEDGRSVWQPPLGEKFQRQWASRRAYVENFVNRDRVARRTGVVAPGWGRQ